MVMPLHPYHFNQKKYTYTQLHLTALGDGEIIFNASFSKRSSIAVLPQPIIYKLRVYGIGNVSVFAVDDHLFKLTAKLRIEEVRNEQQYATYAYQIALIKLMTLTIASPEVRATVANLINQVKNKPSAYSGGLAHDILKSTYNLLSAADLTQRHTALKEYQQVIDKVNQESKYQNIGIIMMVLSFVFTASSLAVIFPPAIPLGLALAGKICLALPPPLFLGGITFFSKGSKLHMTAKTMENLLAAHTKTETKTTDEEHKDSIFSNEFNYRGL